jgi:N-acetylglutamate synthase-like GNAT family acetyltransferase
VKSSPLPSESIVIRNTLFPGDLGNLISLHGSLYAKEYGLDITFEAYVAIPLAEFANRNSSRECIWIAEQDRKMVGCIAMVEKSQEIAQLRWFLVTPEARGHGLGRQLLESAIAFAKAGGYQKVILGTFSKLSTAGHLYRSVGFQRMQAIPMHIWGADLIEEEYELIF